MFLRNPCFLWTVVGRAKRRGPAHPPTLNLMLLHQGPSSSPGKQLETPMRLHTPPRAVCSACEENDSALGKLSFSLPDEILT